MALTRDFEQSVVERIERDLANATTGFKLAEVTGKPGKGQHRAGKTLLRQRAGSAA